MPMYDLRCDECEATFTRFLTYEAFDDMKYRRKHFVHFCDGDAGGIRMGFVRALIGVTPVHLKGYGFYTTDNRSADEKYDYDHFDGSGTNSEQKARERRIKDPDQYVAKGA